MDERSAALYQAFQAKDARFDGRFFVGISTTGIYCRPICHARQPKAAHCQFFVSAAQAEQAGFRPCLLCRPELAPGSSPADASSTLALRAARLLDEHCGSGESLEALAQRLGCTGRHLRRVFMQAYHVSPVQYLQTSRLLLAKGLLTDTRLSVLDVAMAAGFGSLRRMNDLFQREYGLSPSALRKRAGEGDVATGHISLALGYRPPYLWEEMLAFLQARAIAGVEQVKDGAYLRSVSLRDRQGRLHQGWIQVSHQPDKHRLNLRLSDRLLRVLPQVLARVRHLFDLYCDPDAVYRSLRVMDELRPSLCRLGLRVPGSFEPFETAVRAILGQQVRVSTASALAGRMAQALGTPLDTGQPGLTHVFPTAQQIVALGDDIRDSLGRLGVISARSGCILALAQALDSGDISLDASADPQREIDKLMQVRGIGSWTAQYTAMRAMAWPDAFMPTDAGIRRALPGLSPKEILRLAEGWRPWRSYALMNLWQSH